MDILYGMIPSVLLIGLGMVIVLIWAAKSGQFEDLEGESQRILMDQDQCSDDTQEK